MEKQESQIKVVQARKIYEFLDLIRTRHQMYLTSKSMTALQDFLNGYMTLGFADDIYKPGEPRFDEFELWILNQDESGVGSRHAYHKFLLKLTNGDEEAAFEKFFTFLDEFKRERNVC